VIRSYQHRTWWTQGRESFRRWRLFRRVKGHTLVSREKLNALCDLVAILERDRVPGAIVECGVFKGGAAALMAHEAADREIYLFDSFEGLPPPGERDGAIAARLYHRGWCASPESEVKTIMARLNRLTPRVHLVKGWFHETFPRTPIADVALLHIDADWYDSVRLCLDTWFDRIVAGGFLVVDDYGRWEGCTRAVDEFISSRGLPPLTPTGRAGHYLRKQAADRPAVRRAVGV
jgi:hypothetical protein